ncbi:SRPBCC family protein [Actinomadura sp. ATCC 31491]|uniref:SRPBCC family protein n=1 Tax=Actinomadura luzonensis TaxID=2805427 RepID=A0ABT0G920_9ACTN|nr:SRPBCC family protein [Actinomadura luzonensis]MCK2221094.1 SRPBCC family protein [Actinomadura luzonensis]
MTQATAHRAEYRITVQAPPETVFDRVADVRFWPQWFGPVVHADRAARSADRDEIQVWELGAGETVTTWRAARTLDAAALRITAGAEEWVFGARPDGGTDVSLHVTGPAADGPADGPAGREARLRDRLAELKAAAELPDELTIDFRDPVFAGGDVRDAWKVLYEADKWPEKLEHVISLDMTENVPNIQFFDMVTPVKGGGSVTTRSVRVCLPHELIVYKQITPPPLMSAHTGHWRFTPTPEGVVLESRHTCTIRPDRLDVLGPGTTVADARRFLRRHLSANSTTNLRLAKQYAEEQAGVS